MKLSICVVTINRAKQLGDALESCFKCSLPAETEFVVIDNASTDNTEQIVHKVMQKSGYSYYYEKLNENLGCGKGRNYAYEKASGEYVYVLDDDAVIDYEKQPDFFGKALKILDGNKKIITLGTQIYDTVWKENRQRISGSEISKGVYKSLMFCGGSHFLRCSFFEKEPYFANQYGCEELLPSLRAIDAGGINAFCPDLLVIHKPIADKWDYSCEENQIYLIKGITILYAIKKMIYPRIFSPVLKAAFKRRCNMYLKDFVDYENKAQKLIDETVGVLKGHDRIKFVTVIKMFKDFGVSIF